MKIAGRPRSLLRAEKEEGPEINRTEVSQTKAAETVSPRRPLLADGPASAVDQDCVWSKIDGAGSRAVAAVMHMRDGRGKSELRRAVCRITSGIQASRPEDGQCHRKHTACAARHR